MAENTQTSDMRKLASATNPLQVVQNPIVVNTSLGVLGAYWARKTAYTQRRDIFGWADRKMAGWCTGKWAKMVSRL